MRYLKFLAIVLLFLGGAASVVAGEASDGSRSLTVLHTSDIHGAVLPYDDARDRPAPGGLARAATVIETIRAESKQPVLVLDSGDTIQGTPLEEMTHIKWGEPSPTIAAMNRIGYQAMAVGNHEFNFGLGVLHRAEEQAEFSFLSANTIDAETGKPAFPPFIVVELDGLRVGVLGLTTPNIPGWEPAEHYAGLRFEPPDDAARTWVPLLRERERCDVVIALAHTGFGRDLNAAGDDETSVDDFAWRISRVPGIDVLLTGHTHRDIDPRRVNETIVSQPSARGRIVTRIDLELTRANGRWVVASFDGDNLWTGDADPDSEIVAATEPAHERVVAALAAPIARVTDSVSVDGCRLHDCAAVDLIHEAQLAASDADLSLAALFRDSTPRLAEGPVTRRWVHALYVYPNTLTVVRLSGGQVKDVLEHVARYYDGIECSVDGRCALLHDPDTRRYNVDTLQGLSYRIDPTAPEGQRVRDLRLDGEPLDLHRSFKVVCNNYRAAGGGGFPHVSEAEVVWRSSRGVADVIVEYLEKLSIWEPAADGNWCLAPTVGTERVLRRTEGVDRVTR